MLDARATRFFLGLLLVLGVLAFLVAEEFLSYILLAFITAFVFRGVHRFVLDRTRERRRLAAGAMVLLTFVVVVAPFLGIALALAEDAFAIAGRISEDGLEAEVEERVEPFLPEDAVGNVTRWAVNEGQALLANFLVGAIPGVLHFFIGLFVFFFILYYSFYTGDRMVSFVRRVVPLPSEIQDRLLDETRRSLDAVFRGEILVALIQGAIAAAGWWLFGYPNPFFWGFVMTVLAILPWVGATWVVVPAGIWTALQGDVAMGVAFAVFGLVVVGLSDNLLRPFIIGRQAEIHPAIVLVGVVGGLLAFGIVGIFLGPLILTLLRVVLLVYSETAAQRAGSAG